MIGQTISQYQIVEELGSGGMAVVYKAVDVRLGRKVALKFLRAQTSPSAAERLLREAKTASALDHPNICTLYEINETPEGRRFIAMAYYEGETLSERLERGPLPIDEALDIAVRAARGLDKAHQHDVIHQDIKPPNVMLVRDGEIKILDFGIAALSSRPYGHPTGQIYGTISYMAPERFYQGTPSDKRSDIWSLGVLLYEMLTGVHPFERETPQETAEAIRAAALPLRITIFRDPEGKSLNAILEKALARELDRRYGDMAAMLHDLEALLELVTSKRRTQPIVQVETPRAGPSIAVLPFRDQSTERDQEHLCFGLAEELVRLLTSFGHLRVAPLSSASRAHEQDPTPAGIREQLGVDHLLEGSVHKAGDRLRFVVRLVQLHDERCLWSEKYDREFKHVFEIQDEIAEKIVVALEITLMGKRPPGVEPAEDLEAYNLLLKGRYYWNKRTEEGTEKGIDFFRQAIGRVEDYARAWAGLADSYTVQGMYGWMKPDKAMPLAREAAERALASDVSLADVYASRACVRALYDWDLKRADADFERALELDPSYASACQWYAMNSLLPQRRFDEAHRFLRRAQELEPLSLPILTSVGIYFFYRRRYDQAIEEFKKVLDIDRAFVPALRFLGQTYTALKRFLDAQCELERALRLAGDRPDILAAIGHNDAAAGAGEMAAEIFDQLHELAQKRYVSPSLRAPIYVALGRPRAAIEALKGAIEVRAVDLIWLGLTPAFEPLYENEDFQTMLGMIGIDTYEAGDSR